MFAHAKGEILDERKAGADLILDGYRYAHRISDKNGTLPWRCLYSKCLDTVNYYIGWDCGEEVKTTSIPRMGLW